MIGAAEILRGGSQHHGVVLLEAEEIFTAATQQQAIAQGQGAVGQRRQEALAAAVQLEHVHIKAALQAAAVQRLADQLGTGWNLHLGEITAAGE